MVWNFTLFLLHYTMFCHISKNCSKTFFDKRTSSLRKWDSSEVRKMELIWMGEGNEWKTRNSINKKSELKISSSHSISKERNLVRQCIKNRVNTLEGNLCSQELQRPSTLKEGQSTIEHHTFTPSFFPKGTFPVP